MHRNLASLALVSTLAVGLAAQTVHLVGPGGFPTIQQAVNAAAPDDIVHVQAGTYFSFTVNKSLRVRALGPVTLGTSLLQPGHVVVQAPVGATVDLVGFDMMTLAVTSGRASLDACVVRHGTSVQNASLHLQASQLYGATALLATQADVTAVQCLFSGPTTTFLVPGPVIDLIGSRFHASQCTAAGAAFLQTVHLYLRAMSSSRAWFADSYLGWTPAGHCAMQVSADSQVRFDRTTYTATPGCAQPVAGTLLGVQRGTPLLVGQTFELAFKALPGDFIVVFASPFLGTVDFAPQLEQPAWLDAPQAAAVAVLVADAAGNASMSFPIPGNPGIADLTLWLVGVSGPGQPLQASPPVGGVAR